MMEDQDDVFVIGWPNVRMMIMQGISGSGKTTEAESFVEDDPEWAIVSRDTIRQQLLGDEGFKKYCEHGLDFGVEQEVTKREHEQIVQILLQGFKVIIDNTNLKKKYVVEYLKLARDCGLEQAQVIIYHMDPISVDEAFGRVQHRGKNLVPREVIEEQYNIQKSINWGIEDCWGTVYTQNYIPKRWYFPPFAVKPFERNDQQDAVICDLDGTLSHRVLLEEPSPHYRGYYDYGYCDTDICDPLIREVILGLASRGIRIIFVSGRKKECEKETRDFLLRTFGDGFGYVLLMRDPEIDRTPEGLDEHDDIVKYRIFNDYIRDYYNVIGVIDDRKRVVAMWEALGIRVLNAGLLNEDF